MTDWQTRVTAFTMTRRDSDWLMLQHQRGGAVRWELPGGHVESGESLEQTAARETLEEAGVVVRVDRLMATCVHEWPERRTRKIICFFAAVPIDEASQPRVRPEEPEVVAAAWRNPLTLNLDQVSSFLHPLIRAQESEWADGPVHFRMQHRQLADGSFAPFPA
ncbi:NUDIX hydrolase [Dermatophilaceae bacterium Sec6.4]